MTQFTGKAVLELALVLGVTLAPALVQDLEAPILAAHNAERAAVGVPALIWSDVLAAQAAVWAQHLAKLGRLEHSQTSERPF